MPTLPTRSPKRPYLPEKQMQEGRNYDASAFDYNSQRWRKDRRLHLQSYPLCAECERAGLVVAATVSDHVKPIRQGGDPWCWSNRQALCYSCHASKSGREAHNRVGGG